MFLCEALKLYVNKRWTFIISCLFTPVCAPCQFSVFKIGSTGVIIVWSTEGRKEGSGVSLSLPPKHPAVRYSHCSFMFLLPKQCEALGLDCFLISVAAVEAADLISQMNLLKLAEFRLLRQIWRMIHAVVLYLHHPPLLVPILLWLHPLWRHSLPQLHSHKMYSSLRPRRLCHLCPNRLSCFIYGFLLEDEHVLENLGM